MSALDFTWQDGERTIRFGRGAVADAPNLLGDDYVLLTTERALATTPELGDRATAVHLVPPGLVDELAAELRPQVQGSLLVALGGGRVIDTAKALAAADGPPVRAAAIPTTLSAAEMTRVHRHVKGVDAATPRVRAAIVINDPDLCASQPDAELAASAANSLSHAIEGPVTPQASPVPILAAQRAVTLTADAYGAARGEGADPDRDGLALAALLSGYTIDAAGYGLHHVLSQTLVRVAGIGHGQANAAMLPYTIGALRRRAPDVLGPLEALVPEPLEALAMRLAVLAGAARLSGLAVPEAVLDRCAEAAAERPELQLTPPVADVDELRALYAAAF